MITSIYSFCMPLIIIPRAKGKNQRFTVCKTRGNRRCFFPSETRKLFFTLAKIFSASAVFVFPRRRIFLRSAKISPPKPRSFFRLQSLSRASSPQKNFLHRTSLSAPPIFPLSYRKSLLRRRTLFKKPCAPRLLRKNLSLPIKAFLRPPRSLFSADKLWPPLHYPIDVSPLSPRENISFTYQNALCSPLSASRRCFFG